IRIERATARAADRSPRGISLIGSSNGEQSWRIVHGSALRSPAAAAEACPVLVTRPLATALALAPGSALAINIRPPGVASALPAIACRAVGIADFAFAQTDDLTAVTTMEAFQRAMGGGDADADLVLVSSKPGAAPGALKAIAHLRPDLRAYSNDDMVAQFNRNGFAYFRQISLVLTSLTMVFAFLLVATLLTVSINQ